MTLSGKLITHIPIKSDTNLFYELWRYKPHLIPHSSPKNLQACISHEGDFGSVGSINSWHYFLDGKDRVNKTIITAINEEKKLITFKVVEAHQLELYETLELTVHIETNGDDSFVSWTIEYEKIDENSPEPYTFLEYFTKLTREIIADHIKLNE